MSKFYESVWFWWALLTLVYVGFNLAGRGFPLDEGEIGYYGNIFSYFLAYPIAGASSVIASFVGLFVPYGVLSYLNFMFFPLHLLSIPPFLLIMYALNKYILSNPFSTSSRILLSLASLLIITIAIDFFIAVEPFESWRTFLRGYARHYCC